MNNRLLMDKDINLSSSTPQPKNEGDLPLEISSPVIENFSSQWQLFLILGFAGLIATASLNIYLWRYNRSLNFQYKQQAEQLRFMQQRQDSWSFFIQDIVYFSVQYPDVRPILTKHIGTLPSPPLSIAPAPPPAPTQPSKKKGS